MKLGTRRAHTKIICSFIKYLKYKDFQQITKTDILFYLKSLRKPNQQTQLTNGLAHITRDAVLSKFFRWLYEQNEANHNRVLLTINRIIFSDNQSFCSTSLIRSWQSRFPSVRYFAKYRLDRSLIDCKYWKTYYDK